MAIFDANKFLTGLSKRMKFEDAAVAAEGIPVNDITTFTDTGSYALNALLSGSIFKGIPNGKIIGLAGDEATGKTYFTIEILYYWLLANPDGIVIVFETEGAITSKMFIERLGMEYSRRVWVVPITTIQEFRHKANLLIDDYGKLSEKDRPKYFCVLDSLGMMTTDKEKNDAIEGKAVQDMTRTQQIKACFRTLTRPLSKFRIPFIVTNHTYASISNPYEKEMSGGCLTEGHLILMCDGTFKPIQNVSVGDQVRTLFGVQPVLETFRYDDKETITIEFADGYKVTCTPEHKFLVKIEDEMTWVEAQYLIGDDKVVVSNSPLELLAIESITKSSNNNLNRTVYDIKVAEDSHYILENGVVSHNSGLKYAASIILYLSKAMDKDATTKERLGNIIHVKQKKGRLTKEGEVIDCKLSFSTGLSRYWFLTDMLLTTGKLKKDGNKIVWLDGKKYFEKSIYTKPEKYFTPDVMKLADEAAAELFNYGVEKEEATETEDDVDDAIETLEEGAKE